jgi:hypothetical protein
MALFRKKKKKFGEIAVEKGFATQKDIDEALKTQREIWESKNIQKQIGAILHDKGVIELEDIERVVEEQRNTEGFILRSLTYWLFHSK